MALWPLSHGLILRSAFDPFDLMWPERALTYSDFNALRQQMFEDMRRREEILNRLHEDTFKDFMRFMNNPETDVDQKMISHSASSSTEHSSHGKKHTFKRTVTVNGKTDTVIAEFDGEKTTVKYDGDKQVVLPGFFDITKRVIENGSPEAADLTSKLRAMDQSLQGFPAKSEGHKAVQDAQQQDETAAAPAKQN